MNTHAQKMSPAEARSFERVSVGNATLLLTLLECECQPYQDVFTYRRWKAQGFQVQKGQKAIKLPLIRHYSRTDPDTGEEKHGRMMGRSAVFCRCQVKGRE